MLFYCNPFLCPLSIGVLYLKKKNNCMLSKTIECLPISTVAHKKGGSSLIRLLFEVVSGSVLACSSLLWLVPGGATFGQATSVTEIFDLQVHYKSTSCVCVCVCVCLFSSIAKISPN